MSAVVMLLGVVAQVAPMRLADVLASVEARGPEQLVASAQLALAEADVRTARAFPNPGLTVGGGRAEPAFSAGLVFRLPIFGQRGAQVRAARGAVSQTEAEVTAARWRLRREARLAYYSVARADEAVAIAVEVEALAQRIAQMAREKLEVGTGTRLDERQAELVHIRAQQEVNDRRSLATAARLELGRALGVPDVPSLTDPLGAVGETGEVGELVTRAFDSHPELRALVLARRSAMLRGASARADLRPNLTFEAGVELLDPVTCRTPGYCVGPRGIIGFDLPLWNFNRGPIAHADAEAHLADVRAYALHRRVEAEVRTAYTALTAARARVRFFDDEYVPSALEVEKMAREGFAVGRSGILPLIEAERGVLDARLGRVEALYAVQSARADLEEASGVALSAP